MVLKLPAASPARHALLPSGLEAGRRPGLSFLMFVDYTQSDCGPYRELVFVPGTYRFVDGRRHLTVSRILVSTVESAVNGRRNWGLPKERADFEVEYGTGARSDDRIAVRSGGHLLSELRLSAWPLPFPLGTRFVPRALRTFAQRLEHRDHFFTPSAQGWFRPGILISWQFDPGLFPDVSGARVLAAAKVVRFSMTVPEARTLDSGRG